MDDVIPIAGLASRLECPGILLLCRRLVEKEHLRESCTDPQSPHFLLPLLELADTLG